MDKEEDSSLMRTEPIQKDKAHRGGSSCENTVRFQLT